ncbi:hypothetical protein DM790_21575 [Flavobacterium collinsii]|nr:hypothetical protein [Flavobacterium collinsii]
MTEKENFYIPKIALKSSFNGLILEKRLQNVENRIKTTKGTINFDKSLQRVFKLSFTFPI